PAPDNLWLSSKLGLFDDRDDVAKTAWAFGAQLGPKVPLAQGARGSGFEGLLLLERTVKRMQLVLNAGGLVDPSSDGSLRRTTALEGGFDASLDLDAQGTWSIVGEIGGVRFFSGEEPQAHATLGVSWAVTDSLDLSLVGLLGFLSSGDRGGV